MHRLAISMIVLAIVTTACARGEGPAAMPEETVSTAVAGDDAAALVLIVEVSFSTEDERFFFEIP